MSVLAVLGGIVGVGVLMVCLSLFQGYVVSVLWGWFIVPVFGVPALSIVPAIGIALVVTYLTHQIQDNEAGKHGVGKQVLDGTVRAVVKSTVALVLGWSVHLFL